MPSKPTPRLRPFAVRIPAFAAAFLLASSAWATGSAEAPKPAAPAHQPPASTGATAKADAQKAKVILYSTAWCGYCRKTRELLTSLQIPFVEKDIEKSPEGRAEYQAKGKGYRGVPLTDIGGTLVKGYLPDEVKKLVVELQKKEAAEKTAR